MRRIVWGAVLVLSWSPAAAASPVHHYVFFAFDRERIADSSFVQSKAFEGAQLKYAWRELEPQPDAYAFDAIRHDLAFLASHHKKLFIQLQDVSFDSSIVLVPEYLRRDPRYHGGADPQYDFQADDEAHAVPAGWVARRWDPAVQARFRRLLDALGAEFDGKIAGINLPETSVEFGTSGRLFPSGFTFVGYRDAIVANMAALRHAFPTSVAMQYANFMPGEWLPGEDRSFLRAVYQHARELGVGVGGPDLLPYRRAQMNHAYGLIKALHGIVPTGIAVQDGNYAYRNPKTGQPVTIAELAGFATEFLAVDYIFWCVEEPFYSRGLLPFLESGPH